MSDTRGEWVLMRIHFTDAPDFMNEGPTQITVGP
jgi:hypothetical protein